MNKSKKKNELRELIGFKQKQRSKLSGGGKERKMCARRRQDQNLHRGVVPPAYKLTRLLISLLRRMTVHGIQEKRGSFRTLFSILTNLKKINPFYSVLLLSLLRSLNGTQGIFCLSNGFYSFLYGRLSIYITRKLKNLLSVYEADIFAKLSYTLNEVKVIGVLGGLSILVDYFVSKICLYEVLKRFLAFCLRSTKTCA